MRTRRFTLALVSAALLSGCATNPRVRGAEPERPPALRARMSYPLGSSNVYPVFVNREAHVAVFEIIPGRGVTMVYPRTRADMRAAETHYIDLTLQPGRMFYHTDPFGYASFQPRYYYAIASAAPLNVVRMRASLGATRRTLGRMYASYRPYDVIDRLTEILVPMQPDEDWTTDLWVDWPMPPTGSILAYQFVQCANGRVIMVAGSYPYFGCPGDTQLAVAEASVTQPIKELSFDSLPQRPRSPQPGDGRRSVELSAPDVEGRRRAEAGAPPPRIGGVVRPPSERAIRYSGDRASPASGGQPSRARPTEPAQSGSSGKSQPVERGEPRAKPAPERRESGKERKPQ